METPDGTTPWLWEVIESADRSLRNLCHRLEAMNREELRRYIDEYEEAAGWINPAYCYENHSSVPCSEDFGDDFSKWVVAQGLAFYLEVWKNPDRIDEHLEGFELIDLGRGYVEREWDNEVDQEEYRGWQSPLGIADAIYYRRYGKQYSSGEEF